jgi:hypothetical protein
MLHRPPLILGQIWWHQGGQGGGRLILGRRGWRVLHGIGGGQCAGEAPRCPNDGSGSGGWTTTVCRPPLPHLGSPAPMAFIARGGGIFASSHGKIPTEWFARLASAGDDDTYEHRFPHWGLHHGASPLSCLLNSILWALDFWFVVVWQHGLGSSGLHLLVIVAGHVPTPRISWCGP